ncbi:hypothetical protein MNB_SM-6-986 [hydrothermal vent metagenome]|uniref:Uncharacterized protein n=1 Tax=hydrothermal vent metagenome TaxID=652676 RepID=A0A1W1CE70_9ZZZZ
MFFNVWGWVLSQSPWREIVYPSGKTISQLNRYTPKSNML